MWILFTEIHFICCILIKLSHKYIKLVKYRWWLIFASYPLFIRLSCNTLLSHVSSTAGKTKTNKNNSKIREEWRGSLSYCIFYQINKKHQEQSLRRMRGSGCLDRKELKLMKCCISQKKPKDERWLQILKQSLYRATKARTIHSCILNLGYGSCEKKRFSYQWNEQAPWQSHLCHRRSSCCCCPLQMSPWGENQWHPG